MTTPLNQNELADFWAFAGGGLNNLLVGENRVVYWNGRYILVQKSDTPTYSGYWYVTDVSDQSGLLTGILTEDPQAILNWLYVLPDIVSSYVSSAIRITAEVAAGTGKNLEQIAIDVAAAAGQALAAAVKPVVPDLTALLIPLAIVLGVVYLNPRRT